jgi:hypothetical protein
MPHEVGHALAYPPTRLFRFGAAAPQKNQDTEDRHQGNTNQTNRRSIHNHAPFLVTLSADYIFSIIGKRSRTSRVITGPMVTTNSEGSTQKKIGNTSFTASLAARSSAFWRAITRR